jgi:DNA replication and repair protein RecF
MDVVGERDAAGADVGPAGPARPRSRLHHLALRDFRNFVRADVAFPAEGLAVVGENGHGKTNLLEAIYYFQLLRSLRGARDPDLVRFGAGGFHLAAEGEVVVEGRPRARTAAVGFERGGRRKRVKLDGGEPPRLADALGAVPSVIFSPNDVTLVTGSPSERRRYLDVVLALTSRPYLAALQAYRGALANRNAALRDVARSGRGDARVAVWEPALAEHGAVLWAERTAWVARRGVEFGRLCEAIGERGPASMRYATALLAGEARSANAPADDERGAVVARARAALERALADKRALDVRRGVTHAGPHRDDVELQLDGRELRTFGSAGQQRTAAIALRMLEAATLRDHAGGEPLFLLDDPFAELDVRRSHRILALLADAGLGQTVLVVPRAADIPEELTWLERRTVRDGVLFG